MDTMMELKLESNQEPKRAPKNVDRVTLGSFEAKIIDQWIKQIYDNTRGFLTLSRSEVVNFVIRDHQAELSSRELTRLRSDHYDPIKHIQWITPQIKEAFQASDQERVHQLQDELRQVVLSTTKGAKEIKDAHGELESPTLRTKKKRLQKDSESQAPTTNEASPTV